MNRIRKKHIVLLLLIGTLLASPGFAFGRKGRGASFKAAFGMKLNAKDVVALVHQLKTNNALYGSKVRPVRLSKSVTRSAIANMLKTGQGDESGDVQVTMQDMDAFKAALGLSGKTTLSLGITNVTTLSNGNVTFLVPYNYYGLYF